MTQEEICSFARAFPTGKAKPTELAIQLKAALAGAKGIRLNEICFVATDSRLKDASVAAQLAAASLGGDQDEFRKWLNDPQKLLELIAAAQGPGGAERLAQAQDRAAQREVPDQVVATTLVQATAAEEYPETLMEWVVQAPEDQALGTQELGAQV